MKRLMSFVTLIWIVSYALSFVGGRIGGIADKVALAAGLVFVAELVAAFRRSSGPGDFFRRNAAELLMVLPVFRCLKVFRALKRYRRLLAIMDNLLEGIDIFLRVKLPALIGKIHNTPKRAI